MNDRPASLLTNSQREYLRGEHEHENAANERNMRSRLRNRVYTGLEYDGHLLTNIEPSDRKQIFSDWERRDYRSLPDDLAVEVGDDFGDVSHELQFRNDRERTILKSGIEELMTFIYLGVHEGNVGDFEEILANAINQAHNEREKPVKKVDISIDVVEYQEKPVEEMKIKELEERFAAGEMDREEYLDKFAEKRMAKKREEGSLSAQSPGATENYREWLAEMSEMFSGHPEEQPR